VTRDDDSAAEGGTVVGVLAVRARVCKRLATADTPVRLLSTV